MDLSKSDLDPHELKSIFRAAELGAKYRNSELSTEEAIELQRWLDASDKHKAWFEAILEEENINTELATFRVFDDSKAEVFEDILSRTGIEVTGLTRRRSLSRARLLVYSGVAAILLIGFFVYQYTVSHKQASEVASVQAHGGDALPGGDKAVLRLSSGKTVVLDSAHTGSIAKEGGANILNQADGQLSYQGDSKETSETFFNTITTPKAGQYKIVLADGTKIWLNAGSKLEFPTKFTIGSQRLVKLDGEAFFDVAHMAGSPFIVQTASQRVEVLGTQFDVMTYADEPSGEATTLLSGKVRVAGGNGAFQTLVPGSQVQVGRGSGTLHVSQDVDLDEVVAWHNNEFKFVHRDLQSIMRQISRWYDVEVVYSGPVPTVHFNATISRFSNASRVLKLLELTNAVHFDIEGKKIIVKP
jgi:ferric-dicitrate binding protein FerR (iron transport regulator)